MNTVQTMIHAPDPPLKIEREYTIGGHEYILIEGVRYDAGYFRAFANPETDVLYAVQRDDDTVKLTIVRDEREAEKFFEEVRNGL